MRCGLGGALPMLYLVPQGPYLGLLKEWGPLFILDVCDLAFLYLERGSQPGDPSRRLCVPPPTPPLPQVSTTWM